MENLNLRADAVKHICSLSIRAHSSHPFVLDGAFDPSLAIFAFAGSSGPNSDDDGWFSGEEGGSLFGEVEIDSSIFPSLRNVGSDKVASVYGAFQSRFKQILNDSSLEHEVNKAIAERKHIVFTGHSSGGPISVLATIWLLEQPRQSIPSCVTFGSPLVGDSIFGHAIRRENWSCCFLHFVTKRDLVPRVLLAPLPSIKENFHTMLHLLFQHATIMGYPAIEITQLVSSFYITVLRNTSSVASHDACLYMECTNMLLEALPAFIKFSPFRPFGSYAFLAGNGRVLSVKNANAILQLLFYSLQLSSGEEVSNVAFKSVVEHMSYESEVQAILEFIHLDHLEDVYGKRREMTSASMVLDDLGLSTEARLRLSAVGEWEKKKQNNQSKIDGDYKNIEEMLNNLKKYREECRIHEVGYYDAFKLQRNEVDFIANIKRAELAGHWDEIKEMLRRNELPEDFEARPNWVNLGNTYRCLVEPLDIANYYNRAKNDDTGPYMIKGRPQRYKYMQRWFEHSQRKKQQIQVFPRRSSLQSCFWAFVEELCIKTSESNHFEEVRGIVLELENEAEGWLMDSEFCRDVLLKDSTFVKWWNTLPEQHRLSSCIAPLMK